MDEWCQQEWVVTDAERSPPLASKMFSEFLFPALCSAKASLKKNFPEENFPGFSSQRAVVCTGKE